MRKNGGYAMLGDLYKMLDFSTWETQTPEASVRRIVQEPAVPESKKKFFNVQPGLWALTECRETVLKKFRLDGLFDSATTDESVKERTQEFNHSYYQGLIVEIGNMQGLETFVPRNNQRKLFLEKPLQEIITLPKIHDFTYREIVKLASGVDVIWFGERKLPFAFYEVEHTTDIKNSLGKFLELQDFHASFYIVADQSRQSQFDRQMQSSQFKPLENRVEFHDYESLVMQYTLMCKLAKIKTI